MLRQNPDGVPCGTAVDFPRYPVRGFMLDIARTPYPLSYLKDLIRTMSWYKLNDLHLVINNNYIFHEHYVDNGHDPFKESYSAFRLESNVKGKDGTPLTAKDLSYTKKEFADLIGLRQTPWRQHRAGIRHPRPRALLHPGASGPDLQRPHEP